MYVNTTQNSSSDFNSQQMNVLKPFIHSHMPTVPEESLPHAASHLSSSYNSSDYSPGTST